MELRVGQATTVVTGSLQETVLTETKANAATRDGQAHEAHLADLANLAALEFRALLVRKALLVQRGMPEEQA